MSSFRVPILTEEGVIDDQFLPEGIGSGAGMMRVDFAFPGDATVRAGALPAVFPMAVTLVWVAIAGHGLESGATVFDVNVDGTSIFPDQGDRPSYGYQPRSWSVSAAVPALAPITVDIDAAPATPAMSDFVVSVFAVVAG